MSVAACKALKAVKRAEGRPGAERTGGSDTLGNCHRQKATAEGFDSRQGSFVGAGFVPSCRRSRRVEPFGRLGNNSLFFFKSSALGNKPGRIRSEEHTSEL